MKSKRAAILLVMIGLVGGRSHAQGTRADYERADQLAATWNGKVARAKVEPHWFAQNRFWYRNDLGPSGWEFVVVDCAAGTRKAAFDAGRLARALNIAGAGKFTGDRLNADNLEFAEDGKSISFDAGGARWAFDPVKETIEKIGKPKPAAPRPNRLRRPDAQGRTEGPRGANSPDGKWSATLKPATGMPADRVNLVLTEKATGREFPLTDDGGRSPDGRVESGVFWSPDSSRFVALRTKPAQEHLVHLIESSPKDQLQPKLHSISYLKPGDEIAVTRPMLFDVATRKEVAIPRELFATPWSLSQFRWSPDSSHFTFLYNQRGHQAMRIVSVDGRSGEARAIVDEATKTFIDWTGKVFTRYLDDTSEIVWMSERDGWNHLYLYDAATGKVKNQITRGPWVVRGVDRVDEKARQIWFRAGGIDPQQDPYHVQVCRVNFDGTGLVRLTAGDGNHRVAYSPDGKFLLDAYSRVDLPPVHEVRRTSDGGLVCEIERADVTALSAAGWKPPERFVAKGRDGTTDIYGLIHRPTNFDPAKRYPVIEDLYAGPQGAFVPKDFAAFHRQQAMAELGFVVVQIDGMGTSQRSKAFHDVCWKNLADAGLPDRIAWIKSAAAKYPSMDLTRVGVYGTSAGGQSALGALLFHGDFYKAAVADCGCHDNRMDKIWWNEQWMGWPVGPEYAAQSNVTNASKLTGTLMLFVGEMDNNVDPASTMQVVNALIKADKDFDLVVFPGAGHGQGGAYGQRRRRDFFVRNLLGVEPRRD